MPFVIENMEQYDLNKDEAETLIGMGLVCPAENADKPGRELATGELVTTALIWCDLGIEGAAVFDLFDAILGRHAVR